MKRIVFLVFILVATATGSSPTYPQQRGVDENWICPDIYVNCPENDLGKNIKFKVRVTLGVPVIEPKLRWKVTGGKITSGQGTEEIAVESKRRTGQTVTATVEMRNAPKTCNNKASCSVRVATN